MQREKSYVINDLQDKSKRIVVICFYDNSVLFDGKFEDCPNFYKNANMRLFTPYKDRYEFYL